MFFAARDQNWQCAGGLLEAAADEVAVAAADLGAECDATLFPCGEERGSRSHEGVEYKIARGGICADEPGREVDREHGAVVETMAPGARNVQDVRRSGQAFGELPAG